MCFERDKDDFMIRIVYYEYIVTVYSKSISLMTHFNKNYTR